MITKHTTSRRDRFWSHRFSTIYSGALRACLKIPERGCVVLDQPQHATTFRRVSDDARAAAGLRHSRVPIFRQALSATAMTLVLLIQSVPAAQPRIVIAGDLLVDINVGRGLALDGSPTPRCFAWTNYGTAGGYFHSLLNPPFQTGRTNPFTYQVVGGSNALFTGGGQGMESSFPCPKQITGSNTLFDLFGTAGNSYTIEVWYWPNRNRGTDYDRVFCWGADTGNNGLGSGGSIGYGSIGGTGYGDKHGGADLTWTPFDPIQNWYHITETYDGTTAIFYVNGVEKSRVTAQLNIQTNRLMLLATGNQPNVNYDNTVLSANGGYLAARAHSQPLSPAEVLNNFTAGAGTLPVIDIIVEVGSASGITGNGATLNGNLKVTSSPATTQLTFFWGTVDQGNTSVGWDHSAVLSAPHGVGAFSNTVSGLSGGTNYYRIFGSNVNAAGWSGAAPFLAPAQTPQPTLRIQFVYAPPLDSLATLTISNTVPGNNYRVQYTDLMPPDWSDLSHDPLATGTTKTVVDEGVTAVTQRYYRVKLLP